MGRYVELVELAQICARNAHSAATQQVAEMLWQMAEEYRGKAAALGPAPEIGDPPGKIASARRLTS